MRRRSSVLTFAVAAASFACADAPTAGPLMPAEALFSNSPVVAQATGLGQSQLPAGFSLLDYEFNATQFANGRANGEFRIFWASGLGTNDYRGTVTCVSVDPVNHRAWIGGVVTQNNSTHPTGGEARKQVGRDIWFRVVDYGEGSASLPDRTTVAGFEGDAGIITSAEYCQTQPWAAGDVNTWPRVAGNIQVH
ncbi:MAG TPA: hypothetical protein VLE53_19860 [Gemmatimonadaceae bacterium]|nr:hypothetical protein [Gemmatimonadaceae bacterium]